MPQMFPMNWTLLFIMFSLIMIVLMMMLYYTFYQSSPTQSAQHSTMTNNWLW